MLGRIVLAVDGSDGAAAAVTTVGRLAARTSVQVLVVHVSDSGELLRTVQGPDTLTLQWETPATAQQLVDAAVERLRAAGVTVRGQVYGQFDTVARELLDVARAEDADLVALGTRGRGRLSAPLLGSVAHRVAHLADGPVLVAPARLEAVEGPVRRILLAVDGSPGSRRAMHVAAEIAGLCGAEVDVINVCEPGPRPRRLAAGDRAAEPDALQTAGALVDDVAVALEARGISAVAGVEAGAGDVAGAVLEAAARRDADLVVAGSRGRGAVPAMLLGSTTYRLLHTATLPVVVAR